MTDEPSLRDLRVQVCEPCIAREGSECHTPGCLFWMTSVDDLPVTLIDHARATTGTTDGRELAEIADTVREIGAHLIAGVDMPRGNLAELGHVEGRLRTLAAPEAERAGVWALIASWERDAAEHARQHPDDGPPALPMASAIRELRDALTPDPPAQGEAETGGGDADGDLLVAAESALRTLAKKCLAVKPTLSEPFPDAPDVTPWDRFVEQPCREAYDLAVHIRRRLAATTPSPRAAEADVLPVARVRALEIARDAAARVAPGREAAERVASDVLDDLASSGIRLVVGWLPGERDESAPAGRAREAEGAGGER